MRRKRIKPITGRRQSMLAERPVIRKHLLQMLFSGACLWRWNDKLRPVELSEIEKQAHKMILAFVLFHESAIGLDAEKRAALAAKIIEGGLFDYFYRLIITDIKPPIFYKIRENRSHYQTLTNYVLDRLAPALSPLGPFWRRMRAWHLAENADDALERRILSAAHLYASQWEFRLIRPLNFFDEEMERIGQSFEDSLAEYADLPGMAQLLDGQSALGRFANLCGQLRFQIRWTQAPRIPATSVLGHMFIVAACAWFFSLSINACQARANNNFFSGLFHDFPEVLTRDIISPVKQSFPALTQLIREYEEAELERRALGPLRNAGFGPLADSISYFLGLEAGSEFGDCCRINGRVKRLDGFESLKLHDRNEFDPKDGQLLKICDLLAAFLEADSSIKNGVASPHLLEARTRLKSDIAGYNLPGLHLQALLADFD